MARDLGGVTCAFKQAEFCNGLGEKLDATAGRCSGWCVWVVAILRQKNAIWRGVLKLDNVACDKSCLIRQCCTVLLCLNLSVSPYHTEPIFFGASCSEGICHAQALRQVAIGIVFHTVVAWWLHGFGHRH